MARAESLARDLADFLMGLHGQLGGRLLSCSVVVLHFRGLLLDGLGER